MKAMLDSPAPLAAGELASVPRWFAEWEQLLSRFRDDSELCMLNRRAGSGWVRVSEPFWEMMSIAMAASRRSNGLVTPTILPALEYAGYDRDFRAIRDDAAEHPATAPAAADWRAIRMDRRNRAVSLPADVRLDFGGLAKGWAADRAVQRLRLWGAALVDAGGDIGVQGPRADGTAWPIGVTNPWLPDDHVEVLLLANGGVATSGRDMRRWRRGDQEQHHIIDPRTNAPARTDLLTATVIAPSTREAEVAAKIAFILGASAGRAWLEATPYLAGLLISEQGDTIRTANLERYVAAYA